MSTDKFILDKNGKPQPEPDLFKWGTWMQNSKDRIVKQERLGDSKISTVFLGLDHNFGGGEPLIWETMIFGGKHDQYTDRCGGLREDALAMHEKAKTLCAEQ